MLIERAFGGFNPRRYTRPWGAKISFPDGVTPHYDFLGRWDGDNVVIEAEAGDVLAFGQRDLKHRWGGSENSWYIVQENGDLAWVTEAVARKHLRARAEEKSQ